MELSKRGTTDTAARDHLALQRTHLANERTLLAYIRTALALAGGGVGALHLLDSVAWQALGRGLLTAGALMLPLGVFRFAALSRRIRADTAARTLDRDRISG